MEPHNRLTYIYTALYSGYSLYLSPVEASSGKHLSYFQSLIQIPMISIDFPHDIRAETGIGAGIGAAIVR